MTANVSPVRHNKTKGKRKGNHICIHPPWMFSAPCRVPLVRLVHLGCCAVCSIRRTLELSSVLTSSVCVCVRAYVRSWRCGVAVVAAMFGGFGLRMSGSDAAEGGGGRACRQARLIRGISCVPWTTSRPSRPPPHTPAAMHTNVEEKRCNLEV